LNGEVLYAGNEDTLATFLSALYRHINPNYPKFFKMDNLCKLGFLASELILRDKNHSLSELRYQTGMIISNAGSSIDTDRGHQLSIADRNQYFPSPSVFVYTLANIMIGEISIRHKMYGESTFFIERNFDPERICKYVSQLLDEGIISNCLTGRVELDDNGYEAVLYFIQKSSEHKNGIANFEAVKLLDIYSHRI
jgi:hypothetical protein